MEGKPSESGIAAMADHYKNFDPTTFFQNFVSPEESRLDKKDSLMSWKLSCLHRAFSEGDMKGDLLVDIGSGPSIYQVMSACEVFNKVILTDFLEVNRNELKLWLQNEGGSKMDWTPFLKKVCELEGRSPSEWTEKAARLRQVVTDVLPVDVHRPQPLALHALPPAGADCLVSAFCLESASPDLATFNRALGHIGGLLRPRGHLLLIGRLQENYYFVGPGVKIPVVPLNEAQVCDSLKENGFTLIRLEVYTVSQDETIGASDQERIFFVKAVKSLKVWKKR
ncbi:phenylethanolamine N-methyltransferase-like [Antennarius striatus]|uniref:phenylethanolamine N-methyltransferase-like n=1 Tax=Antennarius striatus TaxID=241820 RepID=UPI0035B1D1B8